MFGIGMPEVIVILLVVLVVFGPKKLPELARSIGRGMAEFKRATQDIKASLNMDEEIREIKQSFDEEMWRTLDRANPSGVDPFKSRQEEMEELRRRQTEDSSTSKEESEIMAQKGKSPQEPDVNEHDLQAHDDVTDTREFSGKDKGKEGVIGG
jgi:TatA/E family protein of Tat protein translocase